MVLDTPPENHYIKKARTPFSYFYFAQDTPFENQLRETILLNIAVALVRYILGRTPRPRSSCAKQSC